MTHDLQEWFRLHTQPGRMGTQRPCSITPDGFCSCEQWHKNSRTLEPPISVVTRRSLTIAVIHTTNSQRFKIHHRLSFSRPVLRHICFRSIRTFRSCGTAASSLKTANDHYFRIPGSTIHRIHVFRSIIALPGYILTVVRTD